MFNITATLFSEKIPFADVSQAVSMRVLADFSAHRDNDGAELSALFDAAILKGIDHAFTVAAEAHASAVLGVERSVRAGYRSAARTVGVGGPLGEMDIAAR